MDSRDLALLAAEACDDRKAVDIRLIRVDEVSSLADWFVICSGLSDVQVRAIDLACRFGYTLPNAYKSLGGALKELVEQTRKKRRRTFYEDRLEALRKSAGKARAEMAQQQGSRQSVTSENVYG